MFSPRISLKVLNLSLILAFLSLSAPVDVNSQDTGDEITVDSSIIVLNAVVTDKKGSTVRGLDIRNFTLFEEGIEQELDFVEKEDTPFAAVILLDVSGSMELRVSLARSAAIRFLDGIGPDDNVAIYSFDNKVKLIQDFSNSRDMLSAVFDLKAGGQTSLNDAVFEAAEVLSKRKEKRRAIIVLSDGQDTSSRVSDSKALKHAQAANATIYTVDMSALGPADRHRIQNQRVLKRFAKNTGGLFVTTPGGFELRDAFENIVAELGIQYTLGYHSKNTKMDGKWRKIELKTNEPAHKVRTREGYYAKAP